MTHKALHLQQLGRALRQDPVIAFGVEVPPPRAVALDHDARLAEGMLEYITATAEASALMVKRLEEALNDRTAHLPGGIRPGL